MQRWSHCQYHGTLHFMTPQVLLSHFYPWPPITFRCTLSLWSLTSVSDAVPESAQSGGGELVQSVPPHLVPLAAYIQNHGACEGVIIVQIYNKRHSVFDKVLPPINLLATIRKGEGGCRGPSGPGLSSSSLICNTSSLWSGRWPRYKEAS